MDEQQQIKWIGGMSAGQDVTIRLVHNYETSTEILEETLTVMQVHSTVLSKYSKYFNTCLGERWRNCKTSRESTHNIDFVLEAQADVDCYFHCFTSMYTPLVKNDVSDVKYGLDLLKVASQIEFQELMESTSLYLSSTFWSKEDEIRIREYSSSPDFPRNQAKDLVTRLGLDMDESEQENCHKQFWPVIQQIIRTAVNPESDNSRERFDRAFVAELLQSLQGPHALPYDFAVKVIKLVTSEAKSMVVRFGRECERVRKHDDVNVSRVSKFGNKMVAICWVLRALLKRKQAEELVSCFVHLDAIPNALYESYNCFLISHDYTDGLSDKVWKYAGKLAEVVLLMYGEVVAGRLVLRSPERMALLANWHPLLKKVYVTPEAGPREICKEGEPKVKLETQLNLVTRELFSTLPLKEQMEFIKSQENAHDFISNNTCFTFTLSESLANHKIASSSN